MQPEILIFSSPRSCGARDRKRLAIAVAIGIERHWRGRNNPGRQAMMSVTSIIRRRQFESREPLPQREQIGLAHVRRTGLLIVTRISACESIHDIGDASSPR